MRDRHQKEYDNCPYIGACIAPQFEGQMLEKLKVKSMDEVKHVGFGMFVRADKLDDYKAMIRKQNDEMEQAIADDKTGEGFIYDMFYYELANHEYCITYDPIPTLTSLGLTVKKVREDERLLHGWTLARKANIKALGE